jgi:hypothetical protein
LFRIATSRAPNAEELYGVVSHSILLRGGGARAFGQLLRNCDEALIPGGRIVDTRPPNFRKILRKSFGGVCTLKFRTIVRNFSSAPKTARRA